MNMVAPTAPGSYRGYWMFKNANGALFGIGAQGNKPWWVDIKVTGGATVTPGTVTTTPTPGGPTFTPSPSSTPLANTAYDFFANACAASWYSGAGALACPGLDGDAKGFILKTINPKLENGTTDSRGALLTYPQNVQDGYIQGFFPAFKVQSGDRFQSTLSCEKAASNCYAVFRLDYQTGTDPIKTFAGPFLERNEGQVFNADVDLTPLAGKDVKFILTILAAGSPYGDRALWVGPRIYRPGATSPTQQTNTPTPTATNTPTAGPSATPTPGASATPTPTQNSTGIILKDDFSTSGVWGTGSDSVSSIQYLNGTLHMLISTGNYFIWSTPNDTAYQNIHMDVTVINNGDPTTAFGLMCNIQMNESDYYYFAITPDGTYAIVKAAAGQDDIVLTNNGQPVVSNSITSNASSYRIGADCGNGKLAIYVNDHQIASVTDSSYSNGRVGLFTWSGENATSADVSFDDFVMTKFN
jgi:hypothetical protein